MYKQWFKNKVKHKQRAHYISVDLGINRYHFCTETTRVRIFIFFCRAKRVIFFQHLTLGFMTKTRNQIIIFFPPPKSEYFFQQHWESEYFFRKKLPYAPPNIYIVSAICTIIKWIAYMHNRIPHWHLHYYKIHTCICTIDYVSALHVNLPSAVSTFNDCIYVLKGAYCTHLIIVQMALGIQMCKWHSCMENMHMALIMSIFLQIALAFKGLQYFIMLNAYTI
jgi:hypothetical protein